MKTSFFCQGFSGLVKNLQNRRDAKRGRKSNNAQELDIITAILQNKELIYEPNRTCKSSNRRDKKREYGHHDG